MRNEKIKKVFSSKTSKSLAVFLVVLLIGAAVYVNYKLFYDPVDAMGYGSNNMEDNYQQSTETGGNANENYFTAQIALCINILINMPLARLVASEERGGNAEQKQ